MRGKVPAVALLMWENRITPAYAGKSGVSHGFQTMFWDHPRLCGEKFSFLPFPVQKVGSPPPMRGKVIAGSALRFPIGITPAYAGKSSTIIYFRPRIEDHPRLCGEKLVQFLRYEKVSGSPPPMRGKVG